MLRAHFLIFLIASLLFGELTGTPELHAAAMQAEPQIRTDQATGQHNSNNSPRVALVLSGGGARGFAQVGVLKVLEEADIEVDLIVGTSIGAVVGGLYAAGYTAMELDSIVRNTEWSGILATNEENRRKDQFLDQKLENDRSLITLRFDNFELIIPEAISSGSQFKEFVTRLMWNARYHAGESFADLKIPYYAVATDLVRGQSVVLHDGDIVTAIRASAAVPLLFTPIKLDSMLLVDGGLLANIPVRAAEAHSPDLIVAVNTTSPLRPGTGLNTPWAVADQAVTAMIKQRAAEDRLLADVLIEPLISDHGSDDFDNLDSLIDAGAAAARLALPSIQAQLSNLRDSLEEFRDSPSSGKYIASNSNGLEFDAANTSFDPDASGRRIEQIRVTGIQETLALQLQSDLNKFNNRIDAEDLREEILGTVADWFREREYSLAGVAGFQFNSSDASLDVRCRMGYISTLQVSGNQEVDADQILREVALPQGEIFNSEAALSAWRGLLGTELFSEVTLTPRWRNDSIAVLIRVRERGSQFLRLGLRIDDERNSQLGAEFSDINLFNSGLTFKLRAAGGERNLNSAIDISIPRLFDTPFTSGISVYYSTVLYRLYGERIQVDANSYQRARAGEEWFDRYGATASFGRRFSKTAMFTTEFRYEFQRAYRAGTTNIPDFDLLSTIKFGLEFDSRDRVDFTRNGRSVSLGFESSITALNNDLSFAKATMNYEQYISSGSHTLRPRLSFGFADLTTPRPELFSIGGINDFLGYRENEDRGSQMAVASLQYRVKSPISVFFDTYFTARYDIGSIWRRPTEIRVSQLKHGAGAGLGFDSPLGPAWVMVGRSFYFTRTPDAAVLGPLLAYFAIGVPL